MLGGVPFLRVPTKKDRSILRPILGSLWGELPYAGFQNYLTSFFFGGVGSYKKDPSSYSGVYPPLDPKDLQF